MLCVTKRNLPQENNFIASLVNIRNSTSSGVNRFLAYDIKARLTVPVDYRNIRVISPGLIQFIQGGGGGGL